MIDVASLRAGTVIPRVELPITVTKTVGLIDGTRDYFPGHHDAAYARAQGQPDIYLNTAFYQGFADRVVLEWAGPAWRVAARSVSMLASVYPGDLLVGRGRVREMSASDPERHRVAVEVELSTQAGACVRATVTIERSPSDGAPVDRQHNLD